MEKKLAHLEMTQGVVNRLSHNSFLLKGWSVVLVSALFALAASNSKDGNTYFIYLAYFPAIAFWVLDGYFVWQERLFRALYDHVRHKTEDQIDFSMDTTIVKDQVDPWSDVILTMTLWLFHGTVVASIVVVTSIARFISKVG